MADFFDKFHDDVIEKK